jgi:hypothetical protein
MPPLEAGGPPKVRPKRDRSPPELRPNGALLVTKPATLFYAGGRKKAAGMEPKRSCIHRLGEAAGIALIPKTTS